MSEDHGDVDGAEQQRGGDDAGIEKPGCRCVTAVERQAVSTQRHDTEQESQQARREQQRAAVARAMSMDPQILFFDEPSAGLDPIIAAGIDELILKLKKAFGMTCVVVTHELPSAFLIGDRMILLDRGVIVANGTKAEIQASQQPRVRQFLDRIAEPELEDELSYLQMLIGDDATARK